MPAPRKPPEERTATGQSNLNKHRYADTFGIGYGKVELPLGPPPPYLNLTEALAWTEIRSCMEWLRASDRTMVHMAVTLKAKLMIGELPPAHFSILRGLMVELAGCAGPKRQERKLPDDPTEPDEFDL